MKLLFLLLVVSSCLQAMDAKFRLKRERKETQPKVVQQATADPAFLRTVCSGHLGLIIPLLHTVDLDAKGASTEEVEFALRNESALSLAVETGNIALASVLLGKGVNAHQVYKNGQTLLHKAVRHALDIPWFSDNWKDLIAPRLQLVDVLIASKADYSMRDGDGYTVFHACAQKFAAEDAMPREVAKTVFDALLGSILLSQHRDSMSQEVLGELKEILELRIFDKQTIDDLACSKKCKKYTKSHAKDCRAVVFCNPEALVVDAYKKAQEKKEAASSLKELV